MTTESKTFTFRTAMLAVLVSAIAMVGYKTTEAQTTVNCTYTFTPQSLNMTVTAGSSVSASMSVSASGADCATDAVSVQLWDTPAQATWPSWCTPTATPLQLNDGSSASLTFTCSPPSTGYLTYDPLIRILRGTNVLNTAIFDLTINPGSCQGFSLSTDKQTYTLGESVILNRTCADANATGAINSITFSISPPGSSVYNNIVTLTNIPTNGSYTFNSTHFTTAGTYGIRTCINDSTCASGTNSTSASFQSSTTGGGGTTCASGQVYCPAIASYAAGCYTTCPTATSPGTGGTGAATTCATGMTYCSAATPPGCYTSCATAPGTGGGTTTCTSGQVYCPAVGTSPAGCYGTCPTGTGTGTTCPAGQIQCPAIGSSPAGCYTTCPTGTGGGTTPSTGCAVGARCPSNSWCSSGNSCYYPNGEITCVAWTTGATTAPATPAGSSYECPSGTSECSPTDTSCVVAGQIVPYSSSKWCRNSTQYYSSDGANMTCVKNGATPPAGYTTCRPGDTNCIPTGGYGSSNGWCSGMSSQCYQKTTDTNPNNDKYCAPTASGSSDVTCPAGYSVCSSTDTNCKAKGDSWTDSNTSYWCSNSQKCTLATSGGTCVGWNESCPVGTKYCSASDPNCVEPGNRKTKTSGSNVYYWCGGGGMDFHSATEVYCPPKKAGTTTAGMMTGEEVKAILAQLGKGWGLCEQAGSSSSSTCIEPGQSGPSSGWCAWWPPNSSGPAPMPASSPLAVSRTCPSLDGGVVEPPKPPPPDDIHAGCDVKMLNKNASGEFVDEQGNIFRPIVPTVVGGPSYEYRFFASGGHYHWCAKKDQPVCSQVVTKAHNPTSNECRDFPTPCDVPAGWVEGLPASGKCGEKPPVICPKGLSPETVFCQPGKVLKKFPGPPGCGDYTVCSDEDDGIPPGDIRLYIKQLREQLRGHRFFLKDIEHQVKNAPVDNEDVKEAQALVEKGKVLASELDKLLKSGNYGKENIKVINEKMAALQEIIAELQLLAPSFQVFRECEFLKLELERLSGELDPDRYGDFDKDTVEELEELGEKTDELEQDRVEACASGDEFEVQDVRDGLSDIWQEWQELRQSIHGDISRSQVGIMLAAMRRGFNELQSRVSEKGITDEAFLTLLDKINTGMKACETGVGLKNYEGAKRCVDNLQTLFSNLEPFVRQYGIDVDYDVDPRDVFMRVFEERIAKKIEALVNDRLATLEVVLDEKFQTIAAKLAEISDTVKIKTEEVTQAAANIINLKEELQNRIQEHRESILAQLEEMKVNQVKQTQVRETLEEAMNIAARTNWVGDKGEEVRQKLVSASELLKAGTLSLEDAKEILTFCEQAVHENQEEAFRIGATAFRDVPTELWFHGPAQFARQREYILGRRDTRGNPTFEFVPNQPTNWGEAIAMAVRLFDIPQGQSDQLTAPVTSAAPWMYPYVNGAAQFGANISGKCMTCPVTRIEVAQLLAELGRNYVTVSDSAAVAETTYRDFPELHSDPRRFAVDALTQAGVFQGSGTGEFNPDNNLLRTEMAAVLQRFTENVVEK